VKRLGERFGFVGDNARHRRKDSQSHHAVPSLKIVHSPRILDIHLNSGRAHEHDGFPASRKYRAINRVGKPTSDSDRVHRSTNTRVTATHRSQGQVIAKVHRHIPWDGCVSRHPSDPPSESCPRGTTVNYITGTTSSLLSFFLIALLYPCAYFRKD
jgi:hypothetical protein